MCMRLRLTSLFAVLLLALLAAPGQGAGEPAPGKKNSITRAVDWVRANNAFGPDHKVVATTAKHLEATVKDGQAFVLRLGSGLVKGGKQTWLCGWGGELVAFELTPEQLKAAPLEPKGVALTAIDLPAARGKPEVGLSDLKIQNANALDPTKPLTGTVAVKILSGKKGLRGEFALRMTYLANGKKITSVKHHPSEYLIPGAKPMAFQFVPLSQTTSKVAGPVVAFLDLVRSPGARGLGGVEISNRLAVLLNVGESAEKK